jgi:site-specific DNA-methyltransferase (adenine-specific)
MEAALLSSEDDTWQTPPEELTFVRAVGDIVLDPATAVSNPTRAPVYYALEHHNPKFRNGLTAPWAQLLTVFRSMPAFRNPLVFLNPPYGRALAPWCAKVREEATKGAQIITLTPARTDTGWWQDLAEVADDGLLLRGRMTFIDSRTGLPCVNKKTGKVSPAPFPVFYGYFGPHADLFKAVFAGRGRFLTTQPLTQKVA